MSNKMWGGRFTSGPGPIMEEINASIDFDRHLYRQDIAASKAHADMLAKQGIAETRNLKPETPFLIAAKMLKMKELFSPRYLPPAV